MKVLDFLVTLRDRDIQEFGRTLTGCAATPRPGARFRRLNCVMSFGERKNEILKFLRSAEALRSTAAGHRATAAARLGCADLRGGRTQRRRLLLPRPRTTSGRQSAVFRPPAPGS